MDEDADIDPRIQMINQNGGTTLDVVSDSANNNQSDNGQDNRPIPQKASLERI